mgnify:FL=1
MKNKPFASHAIAAKQLQELEGCSESYMIEATLNKFMIHLKFDHPEAYEFILKQFELDKEKVQ